MKNWPHSRLSKLSIGNLLEKIASTMSNHIEFKREVIRDTFHEIIFAWYFIIKVIEGMR